MRAEKREESSRLVGRGYICSCQASHVSGMFVHDKHNPDPDCKCKYSSLDQLLLAHIHKGKLWPMSDETPIHTALATERHNMPALPLS